MKIFLDFLDKRTKYLASKLNSFDVFEINETNLLKAENGDFVVFPPNKKWQEEEIKLLPNNITLFCGKVDNSIKPILFEKNIKHINFLDDELFSIENAQLTAEGVLALIIENSPKSLYENNILLLGGGRITKALASILCQLNVKFSIASFGESNYFESHYFCKNNYLGYDFLKDIKTFDVIVNTRPFEFFDDAQIMEINDGTVFIETASSNCLDEQKAVHFIYLKAPALPQRFCFESAAQLLLKKILGEIKWKT